MWITRRGSVHIKWPVFISFHHLHFSNDLWCFKWTPSDGRPRGYSGPVNPSGWWWNKVKTSSRIRTGSPFSHLPKLWWGKTTKRSLFASYQQEIALAKIVLLGCGMKGMAWLWPSLGTSPDVWPASDPEPGPGRKAEGGQERVCIHGWAPPLGPR